MPQLAEARAIELEAGAHDEWRLRRDDHLLHAEVEQRHGRRSGPRLHTWAAVNARARAARFIRIGLFYVLSGSAGPSAHDRGAQLRRHRVLFPLFPCRLVVRLRLCRLLRQLLRLELLWRLVERLHVDVELLGMRGVAKRVLELDLEDLLDACNRPLERVTAHHAVRYVRRRRADLAHEGTAGQAFSVERDVDVVGARLAAEVTHGVAAVLLVRHSRAHADALPVDRDEEGVTTARTAFSIRIVSEDLESRRVPDGRLRQSRAFDLAIPRDGGRSC